MRTLRSLKELESIRAPIVFAAGVFDGVHKGHQAVIARARERATEAKAEAWVLTFDPHPIRVLKPEAAPALLTSTTHKLELLSQCRADGCALLPFTQEFAQVEPEPFIDQLRTAAPSLRELVVGENWTFGHRGRGDTKLLLELAAKRPLAVAIVPGVTWNGNVISSTRIREAVALGNLDDAMAMLGRPFSILGTVVHGKKLGRKLGFPTANLDPHNEVRPPAGIYAVRAAVDGRRLPAAAYVGTGPDTGDVVEVHLLDHTADLYGRDIEVFFHKKIRDDRRFTKQEDLKRQIARDIEQARDVLSTMR
jgi:riboflavin kinase/FMN adenylyltransferase